MENFLASSTDEKESEVWNNFLNLLENRLPAFVKTWISSLEPTSGLMEMSENGIYLIKSSQSFGIQVLQQKYLQKVEEALEEATHLKRGVRFILDETVSKKKKASKQTKEEKEHIVTAKNGKPCSDAFFLRA